MKKTKTLADCMDAEVSPWIWDDYHTRGGVSHYLRARRMAKLDDSKVWKNAWTAAAKSQTLSLLHPRIFSVIAQEARDQLNLADSIPEEEREKSLPFGSLSPLGTRHAVGALGNVAEVCNGRSYAKSITMPFLAATAKEASLLLMSYVILTAPFVMVSRMVLEGAMTAHSVASSAVVAIVSLFLSFGFKKMLHSVI